MPNIVTSGFIEFQEDKVKELTDSMPWMADREMILATSIQDVSDFIDDAIKKGLCALDLETSGLNSRMRRKTPDEDSKIDSTSIFKEKESWDKIVGYCLSFDSKKGMYIPVRHKIEPEANLPEKQVLKEIKRLCKNCITIYHNAKFDLQFLYNYGIIIDQHELFEDTMILARLYDAGRKDINLKNLSDRLLNQPMLSFDDVSNDKRFDLISPRVGYKYGCSDAICTFDLFNFLINSDIVQNQIPIYNLEKRTILVLRRMENNLMMLDVPYLKEMGGDIEKRIEEIKYEIYGLVGKEFNIGSTQQLSKILFDELGYTYPEKVKTASGQYKTDTATLEKIKDDYPVVKHIIEYRMLEKIRGTYIENLLKNHDEDGFIKLRFNQSGTDTGRFSSPGGKGLRADGYSGINIQSIPSNYDETVPDIRKGMVARPGCVLAALDYAGEELRIATNLSKESKWVDTIIKGDGDLHSATGRVIFGRQEITKDERQLAKKTNFLTLYGGGARTLSAQMGISEREAKRVLVSFFAGLPKLKKWIDSEKAKARKQGFAKTIFGRIRPLQRFYQTGKDSDAAHADRAAVNFLVQGAGADIMKTAMIRCQNWINKEGLEDVIKLLITMHDEIVFEMPEDNMFEYIPQLNSIMKLEDILHSPKMLNWSVPLKLDAEYGHSWHVDHNFFKEYPELEASADPVEFRKQSQIVEGDILDTTDESPTSVTVTEDFKKNEESDQVESGIEKIERGNNSDIPEDDLEKNQDTSEKTQQNERLHNDEPQVVPSTPKPDSQDFQQPNDKSHESERARESDDGPQDGSEGTQESDGGFQEESDVTPQVIPDEDENKNLTSRDTLIYTIRNRTSGTLFSLNEILKFLDSEKKRRAKYEGPIKNLQIRDKDGNVLSVGNYKVRSDAFLALARIRNL